MRLIGNKAAKHFHGMFCPCMFSEAHYIENHFFFDSSEENLKPKSSANFLVGKLIVKIIILLFYENVYSVTGHKIEKSYAGNAVVFSL